MRLYIIGHLMMSVDRRIDSTIVVQISDFGW